MACLCVRRECAQMIDKIRSRWATKKKKRWAIIQIKSTHTLNQSPVKRQRQNRSIFVAFFFVCLFPSTFRFAIDREMRIVFNWNEQVAARIQIPLAADSSFTRWDSFFFFCFCFLPRCSPATSNANTTKTFDRERANAVEWNEETHWPSNSRAVGHFSGGGGDGDRSANAPL